MAAPPPSTRRLAILLSVALVTAACASTLPAPAPAPTQPATAADAAATGTFAFEEATIADLTAALEAGRVTSRALVEVYVARVAALDRDGPALHSMITVNPQALAIADSLDAERRRGQIRGPLHGIPVVLKDNIATADRMATTAGSRALEGVIAPEDAFVARRLREAGAVILGKANLSEWANFRSTRSSSGWSGLGGQVRNPYVLDRSPCGSSSGSAVVVAANLAPLAVGTETDGSIVCPASANGIVGIKPTIGLVSRSGIVPIAHSQDIAGPMARTVADAAVLLNTLAGRDARDATTSSAPDAVDYTRALDAGALRGARIGVVRTRMAGYHPGSDSLLERAMADMRAAGALIVDSLAVPHHGQYGGAEWTTLLHEFRHDLNEYLASLGDRTPVRTLADLIAFNERDREHSMPFFGQEIFILAEATKGLEAQEYIAARETAKLAAVGIDSILRLHSLDALVAPTGSPAWPIDLVLGDHFVGSSSAPAAVAGYPHITVPMGFVSGLPVGLSFFGTAWSEARLIALAYAYEQATRHRTPPRFIPTLELPRMTPSTPATSQ